MERKKLLILGGTGMIGHGLFYELSKCADLDVYATARSDNIWSNGFHLI